MVANVKTLFKAIILKFKSPYKLFSNLLELGLSTTQLGDRKLKVGNFLKYVTFTKVVKLRTK